jgi:hypothetical protein
LNKLDCKLLTLFPGFVESSSSLHRDFVGSSTSLRCSQIHYVLRILQIPLPSLTSPHKLTWMQEVLFLWSRSNGMAFCWQYEFLTCPPGFPCASQTKAGVWYSTAYMRKQSKQVACAVSASRNTEGWRGTLEAIFQGLSFDVCRRYFGYFTNDS